MSPDDEACPDTLPAPPMDGCAPRCFRCGCPIEWSALWTPACSAVCAGAAAMEKLEARRAARIAFRADSDEAAVMRVQAAVAEFLKGGGE